MYISEKTARNQFYIKCGVKKGFWVWVMGDRQKDPNTQNDPFKGTQTISSGYPKPENG